MKTNLLIILLSLLIGVATSCSFEKEMDRPALIALMEQYLNALAKHDPSDVPLADDAKFVADSEAGQVGFLGVIEENNKSAIIAARLKVVKGKITANDQTQTPEEAAKDDFSVFRKIRGGKIYEIEAIGYIAPHGIKNGWE